MLRAGARLARGLQCSLLASGSTRAVRSTCLSPTTHFNTVRFVSSGAGATPSSPSEPISKWRKMLGLGLPFLGKALVFSATTSAIAGVIWLSGRNFRLLKILTYGIEVEPSSEEEKVKMCPRKAELEMLIKVFESSAEDAEYPLILGPHACGKTTLVKNATHCKAPVIYIDCRPGENAGQSVVNLLKQALGYGDWYTFRQTFISSVFNVPNQEASSWEAISDALRKADRALSAPRTRQGYIDRIWAYFSKPLHPRAYRTVIIFDNINFLAEKAPRMLENIQDFAKAEADARGLLVVLVTSDGQAPDLLYKRSALSRARIIQIEDVSEADGIAFLAKHNITGQQAQDIFRYTGGRIYDLSKVARSGSKTIPEVQAVCDQIITITLAQSNFLKDPRTAQAASDLIKALLASPTGRIERGEFNAIVGSLQSEFLKTQLFTYRADEKIGFHSTAIQNYFRARFASLDL